VAYTDSLSGAAGEFDWLAFIDADEFIVLRENRDLRGFLARFGDAGSVSLPWHSFGHNGFFDDPPGLVTASLTRRMREPGRMAKSITRTRAIQCIESAHYSDLKPGYRRLDPNGRQWTDALYPGKTDVAHVNHYAARSFHRWLSKADRGDVAYDAPDLRPDDRWKADRAGWLRQFVEVVAKDQNEYVDEFILSFERPILDHLRRIGAHRLPVTGLQRRRLSS
jgi:hypothetical protein